MIKEDLNNHELRMQKQTRLKRNHQVYHRTDAWMAYIFVNGCTKNITQWIFNLHLRTRNLCDQKLPKSIWS